MSDATCQFCHGPIDNPRKGQRFCSPSCRFSHWERNNRMGEQALYPSVRQAWDKLGQSDLRHYINVLMGSALGISPEVIEEERRKESSSDE